MAYKAIKSRLYLDRNQKSFLLMLMHSAKSLYNQALYNVRQHFINEKDYLTYEENYKLLKDTSEHYRILSTTQGQVIIRKVDEAMKAFFEAIRSNSINKVRLPRYLDRDELPNPKDKIKTSFSGKRIKRGLYVSKKGICINADLNATLNILRKGNPEAKWIGSKGVNTPKRTYLV